MNPGADILVLSSPSSANDKIKKRSRSKMTENKKNGRVPDPSEIIVIQETPRKIRQDEDCYILDGDPDENAGDNQSAEPLTPSSDILIVRQKGDVACRDYVHPRSECAQYPFKSTSHAKHCAKCHCYVCEVPAPCHLWNNVKDNSHCHANRNDKKWLLLKSLARKSGKNKPN